MRQSPKFDEPTEINIIDENIPNPPSMAVSVHGSDEVKHMSQVGTATPADFNEPQSSNNKAVFATTGGLLLAGAVAFLVTNTNKDTLKILNDPDNQPEAKVESIKAQVATPAIQQVRFAKTGEADPTESTLEMSDMELPTLAEYQASLATMSLDELKTEEKRMSGIVDLISENESIPEESFELSMHLHTSVSKELNRQLVVNTAKNRALTEDYRKTNEYFDRISQ